MAEREDSIILGAAEKFEGIQLSIGLLALGAGLIIPMLSAIVEPAAIFSGIKFGEMKFIEYFRKRPSRRASKMKGT